MQKCIVTCIVWSPIIGYLQPMGVIMANTATEMLAGALACSLPEDNESRAWAEISFAAAGRAWAPAALRKNSDGKYEAESALGRFYASELIGHFLEQGGEHHDVGSRLADVAEAIVEGARFDATERAFFAALGEFIALRRLTISATFDAVPYAAQREQASREDAALADRRS
jgi:hypothetical protein